VVPVIRVAVASTPLTATLESAVPAAIAAVEEAGRLGAAIVCLPETGLPGHRSQPGPVPDVTAEQIEQAVDEVAAAARAARVAVIVGIERPAPAGREIVAIVIDAEGRRVGEQPKTQIDPGEELWYTPASGRRTFTLAGLTFGIVTCHEAFRYPELTRMAVLDGAQVVFVPHHVTTDDGSLPLRWCDATSPYNEKALMCRAIENTVYVAQANTAMADQGSITGIVGPDGALVGGLPYGAAGVLALDLDLDRATRLIALRYAPERARRGVST
jgi:predicted amidohydrolase